VWVFGGEMESCVEVKEILLYKWKLGNGQKYERFRVEDFLRGRNFLLVVYDTFVLFGSSTCGDI
jgi:hypothetical protein